MAEKERVWLWDNVKALLIILVVLGHFLTQFTGKSELYRSLFLIVYSFHMPLFVFVSGLFSKSAFKNDKLNFGRVLAFVILFYLLKLLIYGVHGIWKGDVFRPFYEAGIPWYMLAMAFWLCITFVLRKANPKIVIPCSIALSLAIGYVDAVDSTFCLARVITFYPFFFLGYSLDPTVLANKISNPFKPSPWWVAGKKLPVDVFCRCDFIDLLCVNFEKKVSPQGRMRGLFIKLLAFLILLTFVILSFVALPTLYKTRPILVAYHPYSKLQHPQWGILIRFLWYPVSMLLSAAVVCLVPQKENRLSYIGASTLPIYFFHRPLLYVIMDTGLGAWLFGVSPLLFLACGLPLALLLSWPKLNIPFNKLMRIRIGKS